LYRYSEDIILAFPSHEDAARYGTLLEAEMGRIPVVEAARPKDLRFTCTQGWHLLLSVYFSVNLTQTHTSHHVIIVRQNLTASIVPM
jgi:hypothetical protein